MSKHPTPWTIRDDFIRDAKGEAVSRLTTPDPETRAVLLHALETRAALKAIVEVDKQGAFRYVRQEDAAIAALEVGEHLLDKIEAEIAKGKP